MPITTKQPTPAAQVEPALKAAALVAKAGKRGAPYAQFQTDTPAPEIADNAMAARVTANHAGQPPPTVVMLHRKIAMRSVTNPPIALSTFNDMMADKRVPPPDAYLGRTPLWEDETREAFRQGLVDAAERPRRKRPAKRAAGIASNPAT